MPLSPQKDFFPFLKVRSHSFFVCLVPHHTLLLFSISVLMLLGETIALLLLRCQYPQIREVFCANSVSIKELSWANSCYSFVRMLTGIPADTFLALAARAFLPPGRHA